MKKIIYSLILLMLVVSGLVFANREINKENLKKSNPKPPVGVPPTAAERKAERKKWEATPAGVLFKKWEASPASKKVYAAEAKIRKSINDSTNMEAVVSSLSLPPGSRLGFGVMIRMYADDYILSFGVINSKEIQQLKSLKVNDKIIIKSHSVMHAPKYTYPIVEGDYVEHDSKLIYKRVPRKGGC
jgi:CRISPR/Cas system CSM-associated protein Csm3 (group 7 of RAMP superfamily)